MREPRAGRRAAEQVEVVCEQLPDAAVVALDLAAVCARDAQPLKRDALRVEHAKDVVVGDEQQVGGRAERVIRLGKHARVNVAVRADERRAGDLAVEAPGDLSLLRVRVEIAVC